MVFYSSCYNSVHCNQLRPLAPVVMALEGGYNVVAISQSAAACLKVLLGDKRETVRQGFTICNNTFIDSGGTLFCYYLLFTWIKLEKYLWKWLN